MLAIGGPGRLQGILISTLLLFVFIAPVVEAQPLEVTPEMQQLRRARWMESTDQILVAPYYSIAQGHRASLIVMNRFAEPIDYEVRALSLSGRSFPLGGSSLPPRTIVEIPLGEALSIAPAAFTEGAIEVEYFGDLEMVQAWVLHAGSGGATESLLVKTSAIGGRESLAVWDLAPFEGWRKTDVVFAIHNNGATPVGMTASWETDSGLGEIVRRGLGPSQTVLLRRPRQLGDALSGKFVLRHEGESDQVAVSGYVVEAKEDGAVLASVPVRVVGSGWELDRAYEGLGLPSMRGAQPLLTILDARPTGGPRPVRVELLSRESGDLVAARELLIRPGEVSTVDVVSVLGQAPEKDLGEVRPRVVSNEGRLLVSGVVVMPDESVMDLNLTPAEAGHDTGTYPIPSLERYEVSTTFLNLGDEPAELFAHFASNLGEYALEPIVVPPKATYRLSFQDLADSSPPDRLGRRLEADFEWGFFQWLSRRGSTALLARTEARALGSLDRVGFNCYGCCPELPLGDVIPGAVGFDIGESPLFESVEYVDTCAGLTGPYHAYPISFSYSSPLTWDGWTIATSAFTNQTVGFEGSGSYLWTNCLERIKKFFGFGDATSDRCMADHGPDGYDESMEAGGCPGQTATCSECYTCCEQIKNVGECRCGFGGETCTALAAQGCFDCKQLCFGKFTSSCPNQVFDCG